MCIHKRKGKKRALLGALLVIIVLLAVVVVQVLTKQPEERQVQNSNAEESHSPETNTNETSTNETNTNETSTPEMSSGGTPETVTAPFTKDGVIIVNKKHPLPENYAPGENTEAVSALKQLIAKANKESIDIIYDYSGYRSFATQARLYNGYVASDGATRADTYSARPGYSEHQTGLAFDLKDHTGNLYRIGDNNYNYTTDWVANNAAEFGFIVRYRDETTPITGYQGEPWHLRYLGTDEAQKVFASGKTLEEYFGVDGGDYALPGN